MSAGDRKAESAGSARAPRQGVGAYVAAIAVLVVGAVAFSAYLNAAGIRLEKEAIYAADGLVLRSLPRSFPERDPVWRDTGEVESMSAEVLAELGSDNWVTRWFERVPESEDDERLVVQLHAVYYTGLIDTVPHVPERCFVGGGLVRVPGSTRVVDVPLDLDRLIPDLDYLAEQREAGVAEDDLETILMGRGTEVPNRIRLPRGVENLRMNITEFSAGGDQSIFAGYFFITNGQVVPLAEQVRTAGFNLQTEYAYYMKVQFLSQHVGSAEELASAAASMLDEMLPEIMRRTPDWIEVEAGRYPAENGAGEGSS